MTTGKKQPPVVSLQENVSAFFDSFFEKHSREMKCGRACSQCCVANLTVFPSEAQVILDWIDHLDVEKINSLRKLWKQGDTQLKNESATKCVFLSENLCSIYPVRPTVCRAQGLPLKISSVSDNDESESEKFELSLCELNFQDEKKIPPPSEWLDLERLNTLLSIAQKYSETSMISLDIINLVEVGSGRVALSRVRDLLLRKLS